MRRGLVAGFAVAATAFFAAVTPSWAAVVLPVTPSFPPSVTVGQTSQPASIQVTNASTGSESSSNVTVNSITLVPACGTTVFTGAGDCPAGEADPGVFTVSPIGTGGTATPCAGVTFAVTTSHAATGQVKFTPTNGPVVLAPSSACTIDFTIKVNQGPNHPAGTAGANGVPTAQLGYATGTAASDLVRGSGSGSGLTTVLLFTPSILTTASGAVAPGGAVSDSAVLSGGSVTPMMGGRITFNLYGPGDPTCSGTPAFAISDLVTGNSTYGSGPFTPTASGTYQWVASYSGDNNDAAFTAPCGAANESVTVSPVTPGIVTAASAGGGQISDMAILAGGNAPTGMITFSLFGPESPTCSGTPIFTSTAPVTGNNAYSSQPFTATTAGTYQFVASYGGDANNAPVTSACGAAGESVVVAAKTPVPPLLSSPPVLSSVTQSHRRWREGSALAHISSAKPPKGTTFSFTLNVAATVKFAFTQKVRGRKGSRGRCVAPTKSNRHKPSCRRTITPGSFSTGGNAGRSKVSFQGRTSRKNKLGLGTYTLVITAGHSTARLTFTIVK